MAAVPVRSHTGYASKTTGTTATFTTAAAGVDIDNTLYLWIAFDNLTASTPTVSSIGEPVNEAGTWVKIAEHNSPQAAAAGGVRGELWGIRCQVDWPGNTTYTITLSGTVDAKAVVVQEFSGATTTVRGTAASGTGTTTATASLAIGTAQSGDVIIGCAATESNAAPAADVDVLDGSWATGLTNASTGAGAATNVGVRMQWKLPSGAGGATQTYNTSVTDGGVIIVALQAAPPPVTGDIDLTATATLTAGSLVSTAGDVDMAVNATLTAAATTALPTNRITVELWENGSFVQTLVTDVGVFAENVISLTWDSSLLADPTGANVELRIVNSGLVDLGAVEWIAEFNAPNIQTYLGAVPLVATATLTAAGLVTVRGAVPLVAAATLTSAGTIAKLGVVALSASTTLTTAGTRGVVGAVALTASSTLTSGSVATTLASATFTVASTLTVAGLTTTLASAALVAAATLTATSVLTKFGAVALTSSTTFTIGGTVAKVGTVALVGSSSLTTSALVTAVGATALVATSSLTAAAVLTVRPSIALVASATLTVPGVLVRLGAVALVAASSLAVTSIIQRRGQYPPDAILVQTNLTGVLVNIQDDPDSPDDLWLLGSAPIDLRVSFPSVPGPLVTGANQQTFRVRMRKP